MGEDYRRLIKSVEFIKAAYKKEDFLDDLPQVAFAGRSNCGKSTLINALLNRKKLAKVSSKPGYTRSVNFILVNKEFYIVDLPGYGYAKISKKMKSLWERLLGDYFNYSKNLKAVFHLIDIRRLVTDKDRELIDFLEYFNIPSIIVLTKIDKLSKNQINKNLNILKKLGFNNIILTSGLKKRGIDELWEHIKQLYQK